MMEKLNKLSLPATIVIASIVLGGFYYASQISKQNSIEKQQQIELQAKRDQENTATLEAQQKQEQADLLQQQNASAQASINKCITDAYAELKTLQSNFDMNTIDFCSRNIQGCNQWREGNDKAKAEAFTTYQQEWVPQCKLGKRVFIHYEQYKPLQ